MSWRFWTDLVKHRPIAMKAADRLGRSRGRLRWFEDVSPPTPAKHRPMLDGWDSLSLGAVWIGHATVLLRIGGMTVLTDPVFANRVGLGLGPLSAGPKRLVAPAIPLRQLPPLDLILISHAHFDHLDRPTLHRLKKSTPVIAAHNTQDLIRDLGFTDVTELRWGESATRGPLTVTAHQVQHWGARTFYDQHRGFNAYVLESSRKRILYGGDTAYHEGFKEIRPVDLAVVGIGAYDPYVAAHATPEQVIQMADFCRAARILPMHHSTFRLSHEPVTEPLERMMSAVGRDTDRLVAFEPGRQWGEN